MRSIIACLIGGVLLAVGCFRGGLHAENHYAGEREAAAQEARQDIEKGHLEIRTFGLPVPSIGEYAGLLGERLGVALVPVAGCVVTGDLVASVDAYNSVMEREIERRFGKGVLDRLSREADAIWEQRRQQPIFVPATQPVARADPFELHIGGDYDEAQAAFRFRGLAIGDPQRGFELARRRGRMDAYFDVEIPGDRRVTVYGRARGDGTQRIVVTSLTLLENASEGESWVFRPMNWIELDSWEFEEGTWASECDVVAPGEPGQ